MNRLRKISRNIYRKEMLREIALIKLSDTRKTTRGGLVCQNTRKHFHLVLPTQTPRVTLQLCPDDSNNSLMEFCGWRRLGEVTESVFCLQKGVSALFVGNRRQGVTKIARSKSVPHPTPPPKPAKEWSRVLESRALTVLWVSMWKIVFILQLFTKETTAHSSFPAGRHLVRGRVSVGEMKRSH